MDNCNDRWIDGWIGLTFSLISVRSSSNQCFNLLNDNIKFAKLHDDRQYDRAIQVPT